MSLLLQNALESDLLLLELEVNLIFLFPIFSFTYSFIIKTKKNNFKVFFQQELLANPKQLRVKESRRGSRGGDVLTSSVDFHDLFDFFWLIFHGFPTKDD